ncbi:hypothetical protein BMW22_04340 [Rhizobium leguminosarum]|uniref:Uncharacterized protein n=1 Tax=Rhizobium leguminosarum TaxID=384 RepID=A0A1L3Z5L8_RHILE|nr:hypothetical protein BMW22_04340 [Rhizobium leguminosarum]
MHKNNDLKRLHESVSHFSAPKSQISQLTARLAPAYTEPASVGPCSRLLFVMPEPLPIFSL